MATKHKEVLDFWFDELKPRQWFMKDDELDRQIRLRFADIHEKASRGELSEWRNSPSGSLAEIIILDQFSRNIYRDKPEAFANDALALALSQFAVFRRLDVELPDAMRSFLYMPFMHSESQLIHEDAVVLFSLLEDKTKLKFELRHKAIIDLFGRYPHRNAILGRESTIEEKVFLTQPGSGF